MRCSSSRCGSHRLPGCRQTNRSRAHVCCVVSCYTCGMRACCRGKTVCSYTCTPDGVRELTTVTGTTERWAEAIIEASYGRLSMLADPVVLPTLYLPQTPQAGANAFSYSGSLVRPYLQSLGYDLFRHFHTVIVSLWHSCSNPRAAVLSISNVQDQNGCRHRNSEAAATPDGCLCAHCLLHAGSVATAYLHQQRVCQGLGRCWWLTPDICHAVQPPTLLPAARDGSQARHAPRCALQTD